MSQPESGEFASLPEPAEFASLSEPAEFASLPEPAKFASLPDLASRRLGGSVVFANDELFAEQENLIKPQPAAFAADAFGNRGKVYDGWETRRRREAGHDPALVGLSSPRLVFGLCVETCFFR